MSQPARGRWAEAARNDERILDSARAVFTADPDAPIAAVAAHAGVGISALYRRYESKEGLLRALVTDALERYVAIHEEALADHGDPWTVYAHFLQHLLDSGSQALAQRVAGRFEPTPALSELAERAGTLARRLFARTKRAGVLRPGLTVDDVTLLLEMLSGARYPEPTDALRARYLDLITDALRADRPPLAGRPPTPGALAARWRG